MRPGHSDYPAYMKYKKFNGTRHCGCIMKISANDVKNLNLLKHYRVIRKWACKNNNLTDTPLIRTNAGSQKL